MRETRGVSLWKALAAGIGWLGLHFALKPDHPLEFGWTLVWLQPDVAASLMACTSLAFVIGASLAGPNRCVSRTNRLVTLGAMIAAIWLSALLVLRLAIGLYPMFFGKELVLHYDFWLIGNGIDLVFDSVGTSGALAISLACLGLGIGVLYGLFRLFRSSHSLFVLNPRLRLGVFASASLVVAMTLIGNIASGLATEEFLSAELVMGSFALSRVEREYEAIDLAVESRRALLEKIPSDLGLIRNRHVFLFLVESYGESVWRDPSHRRLFEPFELDYERRLVDAGYHLASKFVHSPVKGGGSWLANLTLQSGVRCDNDLAYERILESDLVPLSGQFRERGFRTVNVLPAVDVSKESWPQGAFFRYHDQFWYEDFHYDGPSYGWSPIPDQFAIATFHRDYVLKRVQTDRLFVSFALTSSHSPFAWVPPYSPGASPERLAALYRTTLPESFDNSYTRLRQPALGYTGTIRYSLKSVYDYLLSLPDEDFVFIVLGDHQPMSTLAGTEGYRVPLHVLSRDAAITQRFLDENFAPSLRPRRSRLRMEELLPFFLQTLSHPPGELEGVDG